MYIILSKEAILKYLSNTLKQTVYQLALPEGRMVGTDGHEKARSFLTQMLSRYGFKPYSSDCYDLSYKEGRQTFHNLIAVVPGRNRRKKPVLIGAHYDSAIDAPCADDNAAAVAIALEAGRILQMDRPERDTIIALFDAEEPPYYETSKMGSIRFYEDQLNSRGVHAALIMDLVGHSLQVPLATIPGHERLPVNPDSGIPVPHLKNLLFITGAESHAGMQTVLRRAKRSLLLPTIMTLNRYIGDLSDHGVFRRANQPYLFLSCGHWQHYHAESDVPERLNYTKMARITRYVVSLLYGMADTPMQRRSGHATDTLRLELQSLKRSLGPVLPAALKLLGLKRLKTREDIDELVERLLDLGL